MNPTGVGVRGGYVTIEGAEALGKTFLGLVDGLYSDELNRVFGQAAGVVAKAAKRFAPKSTPMTRLIISKKRSFYSVVKDESGRLREAIVSKAFKSSAVLKYGPGAFAQVNLKVRSGNRRAPYGHIVESGRKQSTAKGKAFAFMGNRGFVRKRTVAAFPGSFFFRRAVETSATQVLDVATRAVQREIVKRYK